MFVQALVVQTTVAWTHSKDGPGFDSDSSRVTGINCTFLSTINFANILDHCY